MLIKERLVFLRLIIPAIAFLIAQLLPWAGLASNQSMLVLSQDTQKEPLSGYLERLVDTDDNFDIKTVTSIYQDDFEHIAAFRSGGYTKDVHWYRFTLIRGINAPSDWVLDLGEPYINELDVFFPTQDGSFQQVQLGDHVPMAGRALPGTRHALPLTLPVGQETTILVRAASTSTLSFNAIIWHPNAFTAQTARHSFFYGIHLGGLGIVVFIYLVFGIWLKQKTLLAYSTYVAMLCLLNSGVNGFSMLLFPSASGSIFDALVSIGNIGGIIAVIVMWDLVMNLKIEFPRIHRLYMIAALMGIIALPFSFGELYRIIAPAITLLGASFIVLSLVLIGILLFHRGRDTHLTYFFIGFLATATGGATSVLMTLGAIPFNTYTAYAYQFTSIIHILFLAIGLAHRIRDIERARIQANQDLLLEIRRTEDQRHFVALMSHEFRTPLAVIDKAAQMIQITLPEVQSTVADRLNRIRSRAKKLSKLVEIFLTSQALAHEENALNKTSTDLVKILDDIILNTEAQERISISIRPTQLIWLLDEDLFTIAIANLIDNALKYSPAGSKIDVKLKSNDSGLELLIKDKGRGMNVDELSRIGNMYFRGQSASDIKGTGLGLHIAWKIITAHGGTLEVQSQVKEGTSMTIKIPV